jgi:hypothetical protein
MLAPVRRVQTAYASVGAGPIDSVLSASFRHRFAVDGAALRRARAPIVALSVTTHQDPREAGIAGALVWSVRSSDSTPT